MTPMVLDASVIGPLIVPDECEELMPAVLDALLSGSALVPQHWRLEVANLGRMAVRRGRLRSAALAPVLADLREMIIEVDQETDRLAWTACLALSERHDLTAYDGAYLELALRSGRPLASRDKRLIRAAVDEKVELVTG